MRSIVYYLTFAAIGALATSDVAGDESDDRSESALLANPDPEIQRQGLFDIGFGHDGVLGCLPARVHIASTSSHSENRCKALKIIADIGPHAEGVSKQLHGLLRNESSQIRIAAADAQCSNRC